MADILERMSADSADRRQLGELLVERGVLTEAQLQLALAAQQESGAPLGEILVGMGFSVGPTIGNALAEQHGGPLRTEYGLAMGPAQVRLAAPAQQIEQATDVTRLGTTSPPREQDSAVGRLTAELEERTRELERVRSELGAAQQRGIDLLTAGAGREPLQGELARAREERASAEQSLEAALRQHRAELELVAAELAQANRERTEHATHARELEQQLEEARVQSDALSKPPPGQSELELTRQQHEVELAALQAQLARANDERARSADLAREREQQLERSQTKATEEKRQLDESLRELELTSKRQKAELELVAAELAQANRERTEHATHARELEQQLEEARVQSDALSKPPPGQSELELTRQQHEVELAALQAQLARANDERARSADLAREREQQLERSQTKATEEKRQLDESLRELELTSKRQKAELELVAAELAQANRERTEHATHARELEQQLEEARVQSDALSKPPPGQSELELTRQQHEVELAALQAQLARANDERARSADLAREREQQLERSQTPADSRTMVEYRFEQSPRRDETAAGKHSLRDLELTLKQHKAELEGISAALSEALRDRTQEASRADDLERQLEQARQQLEGSTGDEESRQALVSAARARAQRRYGPPLRTAGTHDSGHGPVEARPKDADTHKGRTRTIRLWQVVLGALLATLAVALSLYALVPGGALPLTAAFVVLIGAVTVMLARRGGSSSSAQPPHSR